jgi:hypothetical protein
MQIDASSLNEDGSGGRGEPQTLSMDYTGGLITFGFKEGGGVSSMTATVARRGDDLAMDGTILGGGKGWKMKAVFKLSKPAPAE